MSENNQHISPEDHSPEQDRKMMDYLHGRMNAEEMKLFEMEMEASSFESEALEGLQQIPENNIGAITRHLNAKLKSELRNKRRKKRNNGIPENGWIYFAVVLILLLLILCYWVFKSMSH